jgi:uncharacterized membrane protein YphA (DoxX/SURF4 family)
MSILDRLIPAAQAHEKWFVDDSVVRYVPAAWGPFSRAGVIASVTLLVIVVACWLIDRRVDRSEWYARLDAKIRKLRDLTPGALAVLTGIFLFFSAANGVLLADNFPLPGGFAGTALRATELLTGALLMLGLFTPLAAALLMGLFMSTFFFFPASEPFDYLYFFGIAYFLFFFARGRYSLDWFLGKPMYSTDGERKRAFATLRILAGAALFVLAVGKWARPDLHYALMDRYPLWNPYVILQWLHLAPSREAYVFLLGCGELLAAAFVAFGIFTRFTALFLLPVFAVSVIFIGPMEIIGHLPLIGIMLVLFAYGDTYGGRLMAAAEKQKPSLGVPSSPS